MYSEMWVKGPTDLQGLLLRLEAETETGEGQGYR